MKRRAQTNGMVTLLVLIIVFAIGMGGWWLTQRQRQAEAFRADAQALTNWR